jgi:hypothetical protein
MRKRRHCAINRLPEIAVKAEPAQYIPDQNLCKVLPRSNLPPEIATPAPSFVPPVVAPQQADVSPEIKPFEQQQYYQATGSLRSHRRSQMSLNLTTSLPVIPEQLQMNVPLQGPLDLFGTLTIADKLKSDAPSLKDKISFGKNDQSLAERMQLKSISDLKTAIGLNDKFQFINELFEGSADRYSEAVNMLNTCSSANEAGQLFADLKSRYNWDGKNPVFMKLQDFVNRRYI